MSSESFRIALESFKFESPTPTSVLRRSTRTRSVTKREPDTDDVLPTLDDSKSDTAPLLRTTRSSNKRVSSSSVKLEGSPSVKKAKRGFAPPEQYAHLNFLQDHLQDSLDVMFCGVNPGCMSAEVGHHFSNPTNHFWRCLHQSQLTDRLLPPAEDSTLPVSYNLGLTNLVARPSAEQAELSKADMISGVPVLLYKISEHRPRVVCFVGKGIWDVFIKEALKVPANTSSALLDTPPSGLSASTPGTPGTQEGEIKEELDPDVLPTLGSESPTTSARSAKKPKRVAKSKTVFKWGMQPVKVVHSDADHDIKESLFFVMPSTSGRVVSHQLPDKIKLFSALRANVAELKEGIIDTNEMTVINMPTLISMAADS